jgi:hypothetical protein
MDQTDIRAKNAPASPYMVKANGTLVDLAAFYDTLKTQMDANGGKLPVDATITVPPIAVDNAKTGETALGVKTYLRTDADGRLTVLLPEGAATEETLNDIKTALASVTSFGKFEVKEASAADIKAAVESMNTKMGEVSATPTANTVLGRLKAINDSLAAGISIEGGATEVTLSAAASDIADILTALGSNLNVTEANSADIETALGSILSALGSLDVTETNSGDIKTATESVASALAALTVDGKLVVTETNSGALKTACEALAGAVSSGKVLVTETSASAIKTAVESLSGLVSAGHFLTKDANSDAIEQSTDATETATENIEANIGAKADASATTDTGTFSLIALVKRALEKLTAISGLISAVASSVGDLYADATGGWTYVFSDETAAQTDKQLIAAPSAGNHLRIKGVYVYNGATAGTVQFEEATAGAKTVKVQKLFPGINGGCAFEGVKLNCSTATNFGFTSATVTTHSVGVRYRVVAD